MTNKDKGRDMTNTTAAHKKKGRPQRCGSQTNIGPKAAYFKIKQKTNQTKTKMMNCSAFVFGRRN